jgi:hypothetical protein
MHHPNRFVRETAHFTAASMCQALAGPRLLAVGQDLAERLADGLSDNWSQVRRGGGVLHGAGLGVGGGGSRVGPTSNGAGSWGQLHKVQAERAA